MKRLLAALTLALCAAPGMAQFMPPNVTGGGQSSPVSTPPLVLGGQPGTGIVFASGTPTSWRPSGSAALNTACDPFGPDGSLAVNRFGPEWACRYTGGSIEATFATPRAGAEWEPLAGGALIEWCTQGRPLVALPSGASPAPGAFNCVPTDRERVDLIYHPESFAFITEWVWTRSSNQEGKRPESPMAVSRPDIPWVFFTEPHVQFPATVYFRNTARPTGEVSYAPIRRQRNHITGIEFGPRLAAYPEVFGPPTAVATQGPTCGDGKCEPGEACPADCPKPPDPAPDPAPACPACPACPICPAPEPATEAECRPYLDTLRLQLEASEVEREVLGDRLAALGEELARHHVLPAELAGKLHGVGSWGSIDRAALQDLARWASWVDLSIPEDVRAILVDALSWQKVPPVGGRRAKLRRLEDWLRGVKQ